MTKAIAIRTRLFIIRVYCWGKQYLSCTYFVSRFGATLFKKSIKWLRRFKSDRDEVWQVCSSSSK